jgi:hypothetical protein
MTVTVPPSTYPVQWVNGVAHVPVVCAGCGETVRVEGVITLAEALARLRRDRQHQH